MPRESGDCGECCTARFKAAATDGCCDVDVRERTGRIGLRVTVISTRGSGGQQISGSNQRRLVRAAVAACESVKWTRTWYDGTAVQYDGC